MTLADEIASDILLVRRDVQRIDALSRVRPHIFAEQKDELAMRLDKLATKVRDTFGGTPPKIRTGTIADRKGRLVRVERRRASA